MTHPCDGMRLPVTNRSVKICGMSACRVCEGKIVEGWNVRDPIGLARKLGVLEEHGAVMFR
jgi:predicted ester cyclase